MEKTIPALLLLFVTHTWYTSMNNAGSSVLRVISAPYIRTWYMYAYRVLLRRLLLLCVAILLLPAAVHHRTPATRGCSSYKQQW